MPKTWAVRPLGHGSCQPPHHQPRPTQGAQVVNTNMCILYKYTYSTIQLSVYFNLQYGDIVTVVLKHLDSNKQLESVTELCCELWELWSGFVRAGIVTLRDVLVWRPLASFHCECIFHTSDPTHQPHPHLATNFYIICINATRNILQYFAIPHNTTQYHTILLQVSPLLIWKWSLRNRDQPISKY